MPRTYSELYIAVRNRLREAGIEKTVKGSLSPEEYEKVKVKKSEASVEVVRKDIRKAKPVNIWSRTKAVKKLKWKIKIMSPAFWTP